MVYRNVLILAGLLFFAACGSGGGGGEGREGVVSFEGSLDMIVMDLTGGNRAKPGAMGALEAN